MLFALEPVFSMIFAYIFLHEKLSLQGAIGAFLIMVGVVIAASTHGRVITPSFPGNLFYFPIQECLGIRFNAQKMRLQLISNIALLDYL